MSKTIFITGASRGLGRIWAEAFLKRGDNVIAAVRNPKVMDELLQTYPSNLLPLKVDVTNRDICFNAVNEAIEKFGHIDTLINNAGYSQYAAIEELTEEEAKDQFDTNFFGSLWMIQAILPVFRNQKHGHIIQVSSGLGIFTLPTMGIYCASKFALEGLVETLSQEVKDFGTNVTILEPNGYSTDFFVSSVKQSIPMDIYNPARKRMETMDTASPEDTGIPQATANAVLLLVDTENPPLRLILGSAAFPCIKRNYEQRLKTWEEWQDVSIAAQGK